MNRSRGGRWVPPAVAVGVGLALVPYPVAAHALGSTFTLPVPLWLYLAGAGIAVAASFVVAAVIVRPPSDPPSYPVRPVPAPLARATYLALRAVGLVWWYGTIAAGWFLADVTLLPAVLFWIGIWVAVPIVSAVLGNPWPALSPFRTTYDALDGIVRRLTGGAQLDLGLRLPAVLARGPAVAFLFLFLLAELVWLDRLNPLAVAGMLAVYTGITLVGMVLFGSVSWLRSVELFEILNGWFGRVGPIGRRSRRPALCADCADGCNPDHCVDCAECMAARGRGDQRPEARWWVTGLTETTRTGWSDAAFIVLALAGVTFDGLQETSLGSQVLSILFPPLSDAFGPLAASFLAPIVMLAGVFGVFLAAFVAAAALTATIGSDPTGAGNRRSLAATVGGYAPTLLPIAAGYLLAHYLTLVIQGVVWVPALIRDPAALAPVLAGIPTAFIWYFSVAAIVGGHIAAVVLAHRLALRDQSARPILAGLPLVILMIGYTILSLWIIAQPIVIEPV